MLVSFFFWFLLIFFMLMCLILIGLVLIQKGRGGGLAGAFGGGGGHTAFGSKTGDVLTWATSVVFGIFLLLAIILNLLANHRNEQTLKNLPGQGATPVQQNAPAQPAPTTPPPGE